MKPGYYLAKLDIKSAYRHIPISLSSQQVRGLLWRFSDGNEVYLYDTKLPFGARASPTIFHRISQAIKRMMLKRGHNLIVAYQDDFLVIGASFRECEKALIALQSLLCDLGFEINKEKMVNPTKC